MKNRVKLFAAGIAMIGAATAALAIPATAAQAQPARQCPICCVKAC
jgi:hypothetical protein